MKLLNIFKSFFLVFTLLIGFSCHKTTDSAPTLTITAPLVDDQFANGQVITIKGEAADEVRLHELHIKITDNKTGAILYSIEPTVHDLKSYAFYVVWTAKVTDWIDATVTITAENHDGQQTVKTVKIGIWL